MYWAFAIFIAACGLTHVLSIVTLWNPIYGIEGLVKAATAIASVFTAAMLWLLLPQLLKIPSPFEFQKVQAALEVEEGKSRDSEQLLKQYDEIQRALRESMTRLTAVVETAVDGVIIIDAQGRILHVQPRLRAAVRLRRRRSHRQNVKMLMPPPYRERARRLSRELSRRTGERKIIGIGREVTGLRKDGSTFPMDLSVGEAKQDGESIFVGIIHDLTERKRTEAATACRRRRWRRWASCPAASPTTSTICSPSSSAMPKL